MAEQIQKIDHIGIAVSNLDEALKDYTEKLGLSCEHIEEVAEQKVRVGFLPVGESNLELVESTDPEGPIGRFIAKRGEGIHHIAVAVKDFEAMLVELKEKGIRLIDEKPRAGAHGAKVAFVHPKSTHGILLELVQKD